MKSKAVIEFLNEYESDEYEITITYPYMFVNNLLGQPIASLDFEYRTMTKLFEEENEQSNTIRSARPRS